jgi:hypothetical protein
MTATVNAEAGRQRTLTALFRVAMAATVGSALAFQYLGGYILPSLPGRTLPLTTSGCR